MRRCPSRCGEEVLERLQAFSEIAGARSVHAGCKAVAARFDGRPGWSAKRLETQFHAYRRSADWTVLVDRAKAGRDWWVSVADTHLPTLPPRFVEHWKSRCAQNQRDKARSAWTGMVNQWRRWRAGDASAAIPGYQAAPCPNAKTDLPDGWSYGNLMRFVPTRFERKLIQIGPKAAAAFRPRVLATRVGLAVGQYVMADDYWHDFGVLAPRARRSSRLLQFHLLDLASGCNVDRGFKPALEDEMSGVEERLKEREMLFLLAHFLGEYGYRKEGTTLICEAGTATVREKDERLLADLTGGLVRVERGPCSGAAAFAGMFGGRSGGNPCFKASLESWGNLGHNMMAGVLQFPGQTGSNSRVNLPEPLHGRERHARMLAEAMVGMPVEQAERLRLDYLRYAEAITLVNQVTDAINARTDHELEGWRECGHVTTEWRHDVDTPWLPLERLLGIQDPEKRQRIADYVNSVPNLTRERALSPAEVWRRGSRDFVKLPPHAAAMLLGEVEGREVIIRNNMIELMVPEVSPDEPIHYEPVIRDGSGPERRLRQDSKWLARVNPLSPGRLFVYDAKGGFVGTCPRWDRVSRADTEGLRRAFGRANHAEAELVAEARAIAAPIIKAELEKRRHNARVLADGHHGPRVTAEDRRAGEEILATAAQQAGNPVETEEETTGGEEGDAFLNSLV